MVYNEAQLRAAYFSLKRKAAAGIDGVTWSQYGEQLEENLKTLADRLAGKGYRPPAVRRVYVPKPDGRQRALGILAVADKVVQYVVACILTAVWETEFLGFSYAYRPRRSVHDALDALTVGLMQRPINWVLEADIRAFFDHLARMAEEVHRASHRRQTTRSPDREMAAGRSDGRGHMASE